MFKSWKELHIFLYSREAINMGGNITLLALEMYVILESMALHYFPPISIASLFLPCNEEINTYYVISALL